MTVYAKFFSSTRQEPLTQQELLPVVNWLKKWSARPDAVTEDLALELLEWIYGHEDFDLRPPELFQTFARQAEETFGVPSSDFLKCAVEGKKILWN